MAQPPVPRVLYNSACPVCDAGIRAQRGRMPSCEVEWVDVHQRPETAAALGQSLEQVRERLHVVDRDGQVRAGIDALAFIWSSTPSQRWLAWPLRWRPVRRLAGVAYDGFARVLYRWNLRRGHWRVPVAQENADPVELAKFSALASRWWDPDSEFAPLHRINPERLAWIDRLAGLRGRRVLDVGCGGGILSEAMARKGAAVTGIDLAGAALSVARIHAHRTGAAVSYVESTAEALACREAGAFDVVTCMEMLEHVPRPEEVVAACAALVRPGGWVFFSTINRNPLSYLFAIVGAEYVLRLLPRGTHRWDRFIRPAELEAAARRHGLELEEARGLGYNPFTRRFRLHGRLGVGYLLAMRAAGPSRSATDPSAADSRPPPAPAGAAAPADRCPR